MKCVSHNSLQIFIPLERNNWLCCKKDSDCSNRLAGGKRLIWQHCLLRGGHHNLSILHPCSIIFIPHQSIFFWMSSKHTEVSFTPALFSSSSPLSCCNLLKSLVHLSFLSDFIYSAHLAQRSTPAGCKWGMEMYVSVMVIRREASRILTQWGGCSDRLVWCMHYISRNGTHSAKLIKMVHMKR